MVLSLPHGITASGKFPTLYIFGRVRHRCVRAVWYYKNLRLTLLTLYSDLFEGYQNAKKQQKPCQALVKFILLIIFKVYLKTFFCQCKIKHVFKLEGKFARKIFRFIAGSE